MRDIGRRARSIRTVLALVVSLAGAGCYRTVIQTGAERVGETHARRQWFLLAGSWRLSSPAGDECGAAGVSHAETRVAWSDFLVSSALTTLGGVAAFWACNEDNFEDRANYGYCLLAVTGLPPLLIESRTAEYECGPDPSPVQ
jgi:hypothetical protein